MPNQDIFDIFYLTSIFCIITRQAHLRCILYLTRQTHNYLTQNNAKRYSKTALTINSVSLIQKLVYQTNGRNTSSANNVRGQQLRLLG